MKYTWLTLLGIAGLAACASSPPTPPAVAMGGPAAAVRAPAATPARIHGNCDMAVLPRVLLEEVNEARSTPQSCGGQQVPATKPVAWHPALASAAGKHSADMARRDFFDHRSPDGARVDQRVRREGYRARAVGESLAGGDFDAESVVSGWLGSATHCRNLMNPAYSQVGAACVRQPGSSWGTYWTMVLGAGLEPVRAPKAAAPARKAVKPKAAVKPRAAAKRTVKPRSAPKR